jgi:hypothetical protein
LCEIEIPAYKQELKDFEKNILVLQGKFATKSIVDKGFFKLINILADFKLEKDLYLHLLN